jgi:hypothetical protein
MTATRRDVCFLSGLTMVYDAPGNAPDVQARRGTRHCMKFFVHTSGTAEINWLAVFLAGWSKPGQQIA